MASSDWVISAAGWVAAASCLIAWMVGYWILKERPRESSLWPMHWLAVSTNGLFFTAVISGFFATAQHWGSDWRLLSMEALPQWTWAATGLAATAMHASLSTRFLRKGKSLSRAHVTSGVVTGIVWVCGAVGIWILDKVVDIGEHGIIR